MSGTFQIVLNNEREIQMDRVKKVRKDLRNLGTTDILKKLLFEKMDEITPLARDSPDETKVEHKGDGKKESGKTKPEKPASASPASSGSDAGADTTGGNS